MRRVLAIAEHELLGLVRSRFFIASLLVMPVLAAGFLALVNLGNSRIDRTERHFVVADRTGVLYDALARAAAAHNAEAGAGSQQTGPHFLPEAAGVALLADPDGALQLSDRVRAGDLFAFVEIPAAVLDPAATDGAIRYYSQNTSYVGLSAWLASTLEQEIQRQRLTRAGMDPALVRRLTDDVDVQTYGLVERGANGRAAAREVDQIERFGVPVFLLVLMFMSVMSNAQHLVNATIEEKMSKISEVLLGSVSAFQLLAGKLLGIVAVSILLAAVYLAGGAYALVNLGRPDLIDLRMAAWFFVFLTCAALLYGALFQALSSACADLKDAQTLLQPAMVLLVFAYVASMLVIRAPDSPLAVGLSMVPVLTPFAMLLRMAMPPGPPLWQVWIAVGLLVTLTTFIVWAAARVFRVGLLMQGKAPTLPELIRWIRR